MTEAEWMTCDNLHAMLESISGATSDRKQRLVICAYSRLVWPDLGDVGHNGVETAERWADGEVSDEVADRVLKEVQAVIPGDGDTVPDSEVAWALIWGTRGSSYPPWYWATLAVRNVQEWLGVESGSLAHLLRDIFGNPFRPATLDTAWRTSTVLALAAQMYESRDFGAIPILADALQDAGCDNDDVLNHCRDEKQVHVRGCWVVDLVLGKV